MPECKPPVFFTLVVVRHEPLARLDRYMPDVQEALRKSGFTGQMMKIESKPTIPLGRSILAGESDSATAEKLYRIFTADQRSAYSFNDKGAFAYHTTEYTNRANLFERVRSGLDLFHGIVHLEQLNRVSVRMLDLIRPSDTRNELHEFLQPSLLGFRGINCAQAGQPTISSMEQRFRGETWEASARFDCLPDSFGFNSNLIFDVQGFQFPDHVVKGDRVLHGVLDTDSGTSGASSAMRAFEIDDVMAELAEHKTRISELFRAAVTPIAMRAWGLV